MTTTKELKDIKKETKRKEPELAKPPTHVDLSSFNIDLPNIKIALQIKYGIHSFEKIEKVAKEMGMSGISFDEACLIKGIDPNKMQIVVDADSELYNYFEIQRIKYVAMLTRVLSKKAAEGDDKLAQWLLAIKKPEVYNRKKGTGAGTTNTDELSAQIDDIMGKEDNDSMVKESISGNKVAKSKRKYNIHDILK